MFALLHPYKYTVSDGTYHFKTESGIEYFAYFLDLSDYGPDLYTFSFEKEELATDAGAQKILPGRDVLDTICQILSDFFQKETNAMLFVCDSTDGRAAGRRRLFSRKFELVNDGTYEKIDRNGKTEYYEVYSSILYRKDNPNRDRLLEAFDQLCANALIVDDPRDE